MDNSRRYLSYEVGWGKRPRAKPNKTSLFQFINLIKYHQTEDFFWLLEAPRSKRKKPKVHDYKKGIVTLRLIRVSVGYNYKVV